MKSGKTRSSKDRARREAAEALAVAALAFLASEPEHLGGFLAATGVGPDQIRNAARDPASSAACSTTFPATSRC